MELCKSIPGLLFYSDWGRNPHISRAGMDGSNHISIVRHDIKWPNGIAVDSTLRRIYWLGRFSLYWLSRFSLNWLGSFSPLR
jgi:hypothetical protein